MEVPPVGPMSVSTLSPPILAVGKGDLSETFQNLNKTLLENHPCLKERVDVHKDPQLLFQALSAYIHSQAREKHLDEAPPAQLDRKQILEWECGHIEKLADKLFPKEEVDNFVKDLEKGDLAELEKRAPRILQLVGQFPEFKIERLKRFETPSLHLLAKVQDEPTLKLQVAGKELSVAAALFAVHSDRVKAELLSPMKERRPLDLNEFSDGDIKLVIQFFKAPDKAQIPPEDTLRLLNLADLLQAPELQKACCAQIEALGKSLDCQIPEEREQLIALLKEPIIENFPELEDTLKKALSPHLQKLFLSGSLSLIQELGRKAHLDLRRINLTQNDILRLTQLSNLQSVDLSGTPVTNEILQALPTSIRELSLAGSKESANFGLLSRFTALQTLNLSGADLTDAALEALPTSIRDLSLTGRTGITDFRSLNRFTSLQILHLFGTNIKDADLQALPTTIKVLTLARCKNITSGLLSRFTALQTLNLNSTNITDAALQALPTTIAHLNLGECSALTDFKPLSRLTALRTLYLNGTKATDEALQTLPTTIRVLVLDGCKEFTDLRPLGCLNALQELDLGFTNIKDEALLASPTSIRKLYIRESTTITNFGPLSRSTVLEILNLGFTNITDTALQVLPTSISHLTLGDCNGITDFQSWQNVSVHYP